MENLLKIGIPKGSLESATTSLFKNAGWDISISSRNYFPRIDDKELYCALVRAQEMSKLVENGKVIRTMRYRELDSGTVQGLVRSHIISKVQKTPEELGLDGDHWEKEDLVFPVLTRELTIRRPPAIRQ